MRKLNDNGETGRGSLDASITSKKKAKGKEWMLILRTFFPYGLSDQLSGDIEEDNHVLVDCKFTAFPRKSTRIS